MPAFTGAPWRGQTRIKMTDAAGSYTVVLGLSPSVDGTVPSYNIAQGDLATWEGTAGSQHTAICRYDRHPTNAEGGGLFSKPNVIYIWALLPGATRPALGSSPHWQIGSTSGNALLESFGSRTMHFDDSPLNGTLGALRTGMFELYMRLERWDAGVRTYAVDSRGVVDGTTGTTSIDWAQGYVRAPHVLSSVVLSNAAPGGATPATWAYPDSIYGQVTMAHVEYSNQALYLEIYEGTTQRRSQWKAADANRVRDYSWTVANQKIHNVMTNGGFNVGVHDLELEFTNTEFGGDWLNVWDASSLPAGWVRDEAEPHTIRYVGNMNIDPRITFIRHMQLNDNVFGTPPSSKHEPGGRLTADLAFIGARVTNARGEGVNQSASGHGLDYSLADNGGLVTPITLLDQATVTQGGEAGWGPLMPWDSSLPGGGWTNTLVFTDEAGEQGRTTHAFILLAADPRVIVAVGGGSAGEQRNHFTPGDNFVIGLSCAYADTGDFCDIDSGSPQAAITRLNLQYGVAQTLDTDGVTWRTMSDTQPAIYHALDPSPGDPNHVFSKTFTDTSGWGYYDVIVIGRVRIGGTPYGNYQQVASVGPANKHHDYDFDPIGIAK